jgi:hypothetical protein
VAESSVVLPPVTGVCLMTYQPVVSNPIIRLECAKCGTQMLLSRIEPLDPGWELHTFECPMCEHSIDVASDVK